MTTSLSLQETESLLNHDNEATPRNQLLLLWAAPGLFLGVLTLNLDAALEASTYNEIGSSFHLQQQAAWLTLSYQIVVTVCQPLHALLSDVLGRRHVLLLCYIFFFIGQIIWFAGCEYFLILCLARAVVGIGASGMWVIVTIILNDKVKLQNRPWWNFLERASAFCGTVPGIFLGGETIIQKFGWKWPFLIPSLPLIAFCAASIGASILRQKRYDGEINPTASIQKRFWFALFLFVGIVVCLCLGSNPIGNIMAKYALLGWAMLVGSIISSIVFVRDQLVTSGKRVVNISLIVDSKRWPLFLATFFREAATMGLLFLIPKYSSKWRAWLLFGHAIGIVLGSFGMGMLIKFRSRLWLSLLVSEALTVISALFMFFRWSDTQNPWELCAYTFVFGMGSGSSSSGFLVGFLEITDKLDQASMYGLYRLVTAVAVSFAVSAFNAILPKLIAWRIPTNFAGYLNSDKLAELIKLCIDAQDCAKDYNPAIQDIVMQTFKEVYAWAMLLLFAFTLSSLVAIAFVPEIVVGASEDSRESDSSNTTAPS